MKNFITTSLLVTAMISMSCAQTNRKESATDKVVGGDCEGCEAALEYDDETLNAVDTLPDFNDIGPKILVTGTIFHRDGKTPAKDVILYIYHTNQQGIYPPTGNAKGWAKRHGYIRGWIKTGDDGKYRFYTLQPASYPEGKNPAHIHPVVKEPGLVPYWIDEYLFEGDPFLTPQEIGHQQKRGGNGIVKVFAGKDGIGVMQRDIVLGMNIPGY
ncbi:dioxygenase family protein [Pseudochryseolinea flava]|uniref:Intradiol ring-cleavage dioxygenase n=1 Tax=Pseudochryseolinea flava TaxID=2059302 RepID=A0A364Y4N2_9BACT|nr:intradiol ring-cleavage dioxygenase [Pseudochryseolinea flava]RAW01900.1 intradiol ring-cleavage dioxygenase [Pseudochryseolinea flava]